jgi:hypothetical protein
MLFVRKTIENIIEINKILFQFHIAVLLLQVLTVNLLRLKLLYPIFLLHSIYSTKEID